MFFTDFLKDLNIIAILYFPFLDTFSVFKFS